jgi:hypothetical protein
MENCPAVHLAQSPHANTAPAATHQSRQNPQKTGVRSGANSGYGAVPVTLLNGLVGEEDAAAEQVRAGASVYLSFEHLDAVDVAFDGAGAPGEAEPGGDGVLVGAQPGDEGAERGPAGGEGGGHPRPEQLPAAALVHDDGEVADAGGDGGELGELARMPG